MKRILLGAAGAAGLLSGVPVCAQTYQDSGGTYVGGVVPITPGVGPLFTNSNPGKISGNVTASLGGFQPTPAYAQLSVGATSSRVLLPSGTVVIVYNTGANAAFVTLGNSTATATVSNDVIPAGGWMAFTVGQNTFLAAIETAGSTSLNISGGVGLPTGAGGGGGGGGGGSNASVGAIGSPAPGSATYSGVLVPGGNMVGASGSTWGSAPTGLNVLGVNADVLSSALPAGCRNGGQSGGDRSRDECNQRSGRAGYHGRRANADQQRQHGRKPHQYYSGRRFGSYQHHKRDHDAACRRRQRQGHFRHRMGCDRRRDNQFHLRIRNRNELRRRDYCADWRLQPCGAVWCGKGQRSRSGACRPRWQRALRRKFFDGPGQRLACLHSILIELKTESNDFHIPCGILDRRAMGRYPAFAGVPNSHQRSAITSKGQA